MSIESTFSKIIGRQIHLLLVMFLRKVEPTLIGMRKLIYRLNEMIELIGVLPDHITYGIFISLFLMSKRIIWNENDGEF